MPKKAPTKSAKAPSKKKAPRSSASGGSVTLLDRFRKEAEGFEKKLRASADRTIREIEKQFLHQVHAATEDQVKSLERRVKALEKKLGEVDRRARGQGAT